MEKLTKAQKSLLAMVNSCGKYSVIESYKPAQKLVELGLVDCRALSFGRIELTVKHANPDAERADQKTK